MMEFADFKTESCNNDGAHTSSHPSIVPSYDHFMTRARNINRFYRWTIKLRDFNKCHVG